MFKFHTLFSSYSLRFVFYKFLKVTLMLSTIAFAVLGMAMLTQALPQPSLVAEFVSVNYNWTGSPWGSREAAIASGAFIPENNVITGVAVFRDTVFVTVPRWRRGVPSTLNRLGAYGLLEPFPGW